MPLDDKTEAIIDYALNGLESIRPALPLLTEFSPIAGRVVGIAVPVLYQGLVSMRSVLAGESYDEHRAKLRAKVTAAIQDLAAARFGAMDSGG